MFGCLFQLVTLGGAVAAGFDKFSFWWIAIPALIAGAFSLTDDRYHSAIIRANESGRLGFFPMMLATATVPLLLLAAAVYGITAWIVSR